MSGQTKTDLKKIPMSIESLFDGPIKVLVEHYVAYKLSSFDLLYVDNPLFQREAGLCWGRVFKALKAADRCGGKVCFN